MTNTTKIYARQVPPEYQESHLFCEGPPEGLEIATAAGVEPEAVTLQKFTGYAQIAQYEEV